MDFLSLVIGIVIGAAAVLVYNIAHSSKIDKLSAELKEKLDELKHK